MSKKISELTQANTIANTDLIPIVVNPSNTSTIETKAVTAANLVQSVMPAVTFAGANGISVVSNTTGVTVTNTRGLQNTISSIAADFGTAISTTNDIFQVTLAGANGVITTASGNTVTFSINAAANATFTVANNTLTITRDDSSTLDVILTGLANSSSLPANTSDLTNDSGFITTSSLPANTSIANGTYTVGNNTLTITRADSSTADIVLTGVANTSQIPTVVSAFTNDSGYITTSALPANTSTANVTFDETNYTATFTRDDSSTYTLNLADFTIASYQTFANSTSNTSVEINQLFFDDNFFYVATANGSVKRVALTSF